MKSQRILELNPRHPIVTELLKRVEENEDDPALDDLTSVLYDTASLHSGFSVEDPAGFASRIHKIIKLGLSLPENSEPEWEDEDEDDHEHEHVKEKEQLEKVEKGRETEREDDDDSDVHHHEEL